MIKTLLAFISGSVYKTNHTNRTIYLSDGTQHNSRLFHQNLNLLRAYMNLDTQTSPEFREINAELKELKQKVLDRKREFADRLIKATQPNSMYDICTYRFKSGKHQGLTVSEVSKLPDGIRYLDYICSFNDSKIKEAIIKEYNEFISK